jgi:hypothetical protein
MDDAHISIFDTPIIRLAKVAALLNVSSDSLYEVSETSKHLNAFLQSLSSEVYETCVVEFTAVIPTENPDFIKKIVEAERFRFFSAESLISTVLPPMEKGISLPDWATQVVKTGFSPLVEAEIISISNATNFVMLVSNISQNAENSNFTIANALIPILIQNFKNTHLVVYTTKILYNLSYREWYQERTQKMKEDQESVKKSQALTSAFEKRKHGTFNFSEPEIESRSRVYIFKSVSAKPVSPLDVFATAMASNHVPYIQHTDSEINFTNRALFMPTPSKLAEQYAEAISGEALEEESLLTGPSSLRNTAGSKGKTLIKIWSPPGKETSSTRVVPPPEAVSGLPIGGILANVRTTHSSIPTLISLRTTDGGLVYSITFYSKVADEEVENSIVPALQQAFPLLIADNEIAPLLIVGKFFSPLSVPMSRATPEMFYVMCIIHNVFRSYFYVNENITAFSEKTQVVSFNFGKIGTEERDFNDSFTDDSRICSQASFRFGKILERKREFSFRAKSEIKLIKMLLVLETLLHLYTSESANYLQIINTSVPQCINSEVKAENLKVLNSQEKLPAETLSLKIKDIRRAAPHAVSERFNTECQCNKQPIVISPDDINNWKPRKTLLHQGKLFVCPSKIYPSPSVNESAKRSSGPYVCCFVSDKTAATRSRAFPLEQRGKLLEDETEYEEKEEEEKEEEEKEEEEKEEKEEEKEEKEVVSSVSPMITKQQPRVRKDYLIKTGPAPHNRIGTIPQSLARFLRTASGREDGEFARFGVTTDRRSLNSVIHAILFATQNSKYFKEKTEEKREALVTEVREGLLEIVPMGTYAQEFPDEHTTNSSEEFNNRVERIKYQLAESTDPTLPIDTKFHIRGLEYIFNINIFVFSSASASMRTEAFIPEIPKHSIVHLKPAPLNGRPSILLVRFDKQIDSSTILPIYEPIVLRGDAEVLNTANQRAPRVPKVFGSSMYYFTGETFLNHLHKLFISSHECIKIGTSDGGREQEAIVNYSSSVDVKLFIQDPGFMFTQGSTINHIHVDSHGKLRILEATVNSSPKIAVLIFTPPLPSIDIDLAEHHPPAFEFLRPLRREVKISAPGMRFSETGGVWIPAPSVGTRAFYVAEPPAPSIIPQTPPIEMYQNNKRAAGLLAQFLMWARSVNRAQAIRYQKPLMNFQEWYGRSTSYRNGTTLIPPTAMTSEFPIISKNTPLLSPIEILNTLRPLWPEAFIGDGRLMFTGELAQQRLYGLLNLVEQATLEIENMIQNPFNIIPVKIKGILHAPRDFANTSDTAVFIDTPQMYDWLSAVRAYALKHGGLFSKILTERFPTVNPDSLFVMGEASLGVTLNDGKTVALTANADSLSSARGAVQVWKKGGKSTPSRGIHTILTSRDIVLDNDSIEESVLQLSEPDAYLSLFTAYTKTGII